VTQLALPCVVTAQEIARESTFGGAIQLCVKAAGYDENLKTLQTDLRFDKAQFSRWTSGQEGVNWPKLKVLMEHCGNNAPVLWQAQQCGYDLSSFRMRESELERENRLLTEEVFALRRVLQRSSA
jgi:hypothetical protein